MGWKENLKKVIEERGTNNRAVSLRVGSNDSLVRDIITGRTKSTTIETLEKLANELGTSASALLSGDTNSHDPVNRRYKVIGDVQAGLWSEALELPYDDQETVVFPTGLHPDADQFHVLRARGDSMERAGISDGTYLVCLDRQKFLPSPETGDIVIAQRTDGHGHYECTVKELEIRPDGSHWLWPRSDNPEHQQPIKIPPADQWPDSLDQCSSEEFFVSAIVMTWMPALRPH